MTARASGLLIPHDIPGVKRVAYYCRICGNRFNEGEERAYEGHVTRCADEHEEELRAMSLKEKLPGLYGDEAGDPELEHYVRENAQEILEGRKRIG